MKINLTTDKSLLIQGITIILTIIFWITNVFYNWGYFDEYSGDKTFGYYLAYTLWYLSSFGVLSTIIVFICSLVFRLKKQKNNMCRLCVSTAVCYHR